jgi:hypothetical protein
MTIPDIGHCVGSGSKPVEGTIREDGDQRSGQCGACSRRFDLNADGFLSFHHSISDDPSEGEARQSDTNRTSE